MVLNTNTLQLLTGLTSQIFTDKQDITYLPSNWLLHLREYFRRCEITVTSGTFWIPRKAREKDTGLMERALQMYNDKRVLRKLTIGASILKPFIYLISATQVEQKYYSNIVITHHHILIVIKKFICKLKDKLWLPFLI